MHNSDFERPHHIEPIPLWKYQGLARDIENAKKEITAHLNAELNRFKEEVGKVTPAIKISKEFEEAGFVYRDPFKDESISPRLKEKLELAKKLTDDTHTIDLRKTNEKFPRKTSKGKAV